MKRLSKKSLAPLLSNSRSAITQQKGTTKSINQQIRHAGHTSFWNDDLHERYEPDSLDKHYGVKVKPQWGLAWRIVQFTTACLMVFIFFVTRRFWGTFLGIDHGHHGVAYYDTESDEQDEWWDVKETDEEIETRMEAILARGYRSEHMERIKKTSLPFYKDRLQRSMGFSD